MPAKVQEESVFVGVCWDCDWHSQPYEEESDADQAVAEHNEGNHE